MGGSEVSLLSLKKLSEFSSCIEEVGEDFYFGFLLGEGGFGPVIKLG